MRQFFIVDQNELIAVFIGEMLLDEGETRLGIYKDNFGCSLSKCKNSRHLSDRTCSKDGYFVALVDSSIFNSMVGGAENIREIKS